MKLSTRKRLLNLASLSCMLFGGWMLLATQIAGPPTLENLPKHTPSKAVQTDSGLPEPERIVNAKQPVWQRKLREPLYDPPPPPKVVVQKQPRPVTVKLTGTVIEPDNSQAFVRLANGSVALKTIGDQVTDDPRDGRITKITDSEIVIQREDDEIQLKVDGQN